MTRVTGVALALAALMALAAAPAAAQEWPPPEEPQQLAPLAVGNVPTWIEIPRLGTSAAIVPLGLEEDGAMASPVDPDTVGWWQEGPGVGGQGNMLLDGHVDWGGRLRVFGLLQRLEPGDLIYVAGQDGATRTYSVLWNRLYEDADAAPLDEIFPTTPDEQLTLITCGGEFNHSARMYVGRWVVRAAPLSAN